MSISTENPTLGDKPKMGSGHYGNVDVDLGSGVGIRWVHYEGDIVGGILVHEKPDGHNGKCEGAFWIRGNKFHAEKQRRTESELKNPQWDFNGNYERPNLNPSFLCHCGFHGFVREGTWQNA